MKNRARLIVAIVIGVIVAGRALTSVRQPGARDSGEDTTVDNLEPGQYEDLESHVLELIDEIDATGIEAARPDDLLSIELFELDPENEELGEIH